MNRIVLFLLFIWLLVSCAPGVIDVRVAPVSVVLEQEAALDDLRPVVWAMLSGETESRLELMQFLKTECTMKDGLGGPPKCPEGKPEGSEVEVLPLGGPEGTFVTREMIGPVLEIPIHDLYAIFQVPSNSETEAYWPVGEFGLIFKREINDYPMPMIVRVSDGKIVRIDTAMGRHPSSLLEDIEPENIVLPPEAVGEWVKETFPPVQNTKP